MKIAGYARVSTQEQKMHGVSIHAQEDALKEWGEKNGVYVGCYNDAGISARSRYTKRPALLRLLEDVKAKRVDLIIFTKLDRWFRNVGGYYEIQRILDDNGVQWRAIWEDYETQTASGRLKVNIMLSVAQDEADRTGERVKRSIEYRWANGDVAQKLPAGYRREGKTVVYDEAARPGIEELFRTYLNTGNITRAREAAKLQGLKLCREQAARALRNQFYTGTVRGISVPAYISQSEYELIQRRMQMYTRVPAQRRVYLFTGLLICANCGSRMGSSSVKNTKCYTCTRYIRHDGCSKELRAYVNENKLEAWLLEHLDALLRQQVELVRVSESKGGQRPKKEALEQKLERIKNLYIDGDISRDEYTAMRDDITAQIQAIPAAHSVDALETLLPSSWRDEYAELSRGGKRAFWCNTVRQIIISRDADPVVIFCD